MDGAPRETGSLSASRGVSRFEVLVSLIDWLKVRIWVVQVGPAGLHELDVMMLVVSQQAGQQAPLEWQLQQIVIIKVKHKPCTCLSSVEIGKGF